MLVFRNMASILMLSALSGFLAMPSHVLAKQIDTNTIAQKTESIANIAKKKGIDFGFAVNYGQLKNDKSYQQFVKQNATIIVPENTLKWKRIHPEKNKYAFDESDYIVNFALENGLKVRGHTLIWHAHIPNYLLKENDKNIVKDEINNHIKTVVSRYKGKIHSWDVINEVIKVEDGQPNGLRASHWYKVLGEDYIDIAFRAAHKADPKAILVYNEWGAELNNKFGREKRAAILSLLKRLKARNVPIHGFGLQSHLGAKSSKYIDHTLQQFINDVHQLGLKVYVTELDVNDKTRDEFVVERATKVYEQYLNTVLATGRVREVITWGVRNSSDLGIQKANNKAQARALVYSKGSSVSIENMVKKTIANAPQQR